jgi:hypothetical protein
LFFGGTDFLEESTMLQQVRISLSRFQRVCTTATNLTRSLFLITKCL